MEDRLLRGRESKILIGRRMAERGFQQDIPPVLCLVVKGGLHHCPTQAL